MSENTETNRKRCFTCGKYLNDAITDNDNFCSEECSLLYVKCKNCGKYYLSTNSYISRNGCCSEECAEQYKIVTKKGKVIQIIKESL